jgi:sugar phosphate permease
VFFVALLEEFGWKRGESAGVYSLFMVVHGAGALAAGWLSDRIGPGRVIAGGALLLALGLIISSQISSLWQFYLAFGVLAGFGVSLAGWTPCVTMINRWFSMRLGFALGIASAGIGVGIMLVVPFAQFLITSLGWRMAYVVLAGIVFLGLAPVGLIVLRGRPEELGQRIDGASTRPAAVEKVKKTGKTMEVVDAQWAARPWTVAMAASTMRCWLLIAVKLLGGIATQMIFVHQVVYLVDSGYERMAAASVVGLIGLLSVGGKILWGWSADNIGREMTYTLGCAAMVIAVGLLALMKVLPVSAMLYLYALLFALGYAVSAPLWPLVTSDLFAGRNFGAIYGFVTLFSGFGNALGAWLGGYVYDLTGSYGIAFGVAVLGKAVSAGVLWLVAPRLVRRVKRNAMP